MSWVPTEKEIAAVLAADGRHRYEYFVHRACEAKAVWALDKDGWASVEDDAGGRLLLLWPHQVFAEAFAVDAWAGFKPKRVELSLLLEEWLPGMRRANIQPAVFPVPTGASVVVTAEDLEESLRRELSDVYGIDD